MDIKGVVSIDFIFASLMILIIIPSVVSIAEVRMGTAESVEQIVIARTLTENIAETIDTVYSGGEGCYIILQMPPKIADNNYTLTVHPTEVVIVFNGKMGSSHHNQIRLYDNYGRYRSKFPLEPGGYYNISNVKIDDANVLIIKKIRKI